MGWQADGDDEALYEAREAWRGDVHFKEWPEHLAGPEYWMYKEKTDE